MAHEFIMGSLKETGNRSPGKNQRDDYMIRPKNTRKDAKNRTDCIPSINQGGEFTHWNPARLIFAIFMAGVIIGMVIMMCLFTNK